MHRSLAAFEKGLRENSPDIAPSMIYAYAALKLGVPFANGAPNLTLDIPALMELALQNQVPVCGKDYQDGADDDEDHPGARLEGAAARPARVGSPPISSATAMARCWTIPTTSRPRRRASSSVLEYILQPEVYPDALQGLYHKVRINYYPPRGDNKEGWDNLDIFGWLGYPMQIKVDFLCRDSILAAPLVLDLVLFLDLAQRCPELAAGHPGMALVLLQEPHVRARTSIPSTTSSSS